MLLKHMSLIAFAFITLNGSFIFSQPISRQLLPQEQGNYYLIPKLNKKNKVESKENSRQAKQKNKLAQFIDQDGYIWFYDKHNKYTFFLSNSYPSSIRIWNMKFDYPEAALHAAKFSDKPKIASSFNKLNGEEALKLGQKLSYQQRADWYKVRENIMLEILRAKFQQHTDLRELLLATGDAYLVEHDDQDAFWADGGDGKGKNRLGYLLMQVRGEVGGIGPVSKPNKYRSFVK